jgi:hypothetical protein
VTAGGAGVDKGRFQRIVNFVEGCFEDDLLVLHEASQDTVILNPTAAALWQALKWPQTLNDLVDLLVEAFPDEPRETLTDRVEEALRVLRSRGLIRCLD